MVDGADERKMPPEVAEEETPVSRLPFCSGSLETGVSVVPEEGKGEAEQGTAGDVSDEVVRQITQPIIPALGLPAQNGIGDRSLADAEAERLRAQAEEEEVR